VPGRELPVQPCLPIAIGDEACGDPDRKHDQKLGAR
jgi:hypothetical protein